MPEPGIFFLVTNQIPKLGQAYANGVFPVRLPVDQGQTDPSPSPSRGNFVFDQLIEGLALSDECEGTVFFRSTSAASGKEL